MVKEKRSGLDKRKQFELMVGQSIMKSRIAFGLTQEELAARIGMPQSELSRLESGRRRISMYCSLCVALALGVPLTEIVTPTAMDILS